MNIKKEENISTNKNNNLLFGTINEDISHFNKKMKNNKNKSSCIGDKEVKKKRRANKGQ